MTKKRKSSTSVQKTSDGFIGRLFAQTQLPAHVTEEQDWYLDTPDVRLTRVFTIVLILHVVAVGGILAFKMVEKASTPEALAAIAATEPESDTAAPAAGEAAVKSDQSTAKEAAATESGVKEPALLVDHPSATEYQEYRVGSGESLISIAKKLGVSASEIREINNLDDGGNLAVGRWIRVPKMANAPTQSEPTSALAAVGDATPEPVKAPVVSPTPKPKPAEVAKPAPAPAPKPVAKVEPTPAPAPAPAANKDKYQVQRGDTLFGIARQFGIKYQDLMAANGIEKPENLQAGQTLRVP